MTSIHQGLTPMNFLPYAQLSPEFMQEHYPPEEEPVDEGSVADEENIVDENTDAPVENGADDTP